ncbi:hypothetical protein [Streptomyces rishiriensis]|uniref:hypothetical protein n=1 Tax=Streptomyces rishiriensis TaxID=68264 RepID=UPI0027D97F48|nr:hypothetical protein [Streptomyces rishiriensis]
MTGAFDIGRERLAGRMTGPVMDSGEGSDTEVDSMTDEEYLWEPVSGCWSVRRRASGSGPRVTLPDADDRPRQGDG